MIGKLPAKWKKAFSATLASGKRLLRPKPDLHLVLTVPKTTANNSRSNLETRLRIANFECGSKSREALMDTWAMIFVYSNYFVLVSSYRQLFCRQQALLLFALLAFISLFHMTAFFELLLPLFVVSININKFCKACYWTSRCEHLRP